MKKRYIMISLVSVLIICGISVKSADMIYIENINSIEELDDAAVFNFAIMSDCNKDLSIGMDFRFKNMVDWLEESGASFVIGAGDYVKLDWENKFLNFLRENEWWRNHLYPIVSDGDNEYYGGTVEAIGAGGAFFYEVDLYSRPNVEIRENSCEFYAAIAVNGYTVHYIGLHFPDEPNDIERTFTDDTREYMIRKLKSIHKTDKDIILIGAAGNGGFWIDLLEDEQKDLVMKKSDIVLSSSTHMFDRKMVEGYRETDALIINTGSITGPRFGDPGGFSLVHILENPNRIVLQYFNATRKKRELRNCNFAYIKEIKAYID